MHRRYSASALRAAFSLSPASEPSHGHLTWGAEYKLPQKREATAGTTVHGPLSTRLEMLWEAFDSFLLPLLLITSVPIFQPFLLRTFQLYFLVSSMYLTNSQNLYPSYQIYHFEMS